MRSTMKKMIIITKELFEAIKHGLKSKQSKRVSSIKEKVGRIIQKKRTATASPKIEVCLLACSRDRNKALTEEA